jgi:hypothetical protein
VTFGKDMIENSKQTSRLLVICVAIAACDAPGLVITAQALDEAPANSVPCPADYDGDGYTDFALKGSNGIWYIDVHACSLAGSPETACAGGVDDDVDLSVNDGCPAVGTAETACDNMWDDDSDGYVDDGCPTKRQCMGNDVFGGRWDFAYTGFGDASAIPVPADYDGDLKADLAVKNSAGMWAIDYAANGFGAWDLVRYGYGASDYQPFAADFDGDGRADLSARTSSGAWYFDYSSDGFYGWNVPCTTGCPCTPPAGTGYPVLGYGTSLDTAAPGKFDSDNCTDISVKNPAGDWYFDLAYNGFHGWEPPCSGCNVPLRLYGDSTWVPAIANYDSWRDNKDDLAVKNGNGEWVIDYAYDGFWGWNTPYYQGYGGSWSMATPGYYTTRRGNGNIDLSVKDTSGVWYVDQASDGYNGWSSAVDNTTRLLPIDNNAPFILSTTLTQPYGFMDSPGNFHETAVPANTNLKIGVRYTANVTLSPGDGNHSAAIWANPDLRIPKSLNVLNPIGETSDRIQVQHTRRFAFTCTDWGNFALGFMLDSAPATSGYGADYGIRVACDADHPGLYGTVTSKPYREPETLCNGIDDDPSGADGYIDDGCPIAGASVSVNGGTPIPTGSNGFWNFSQLTGGPYSVTVTKAGYSDAKAINIQIPAYPVGYAGVQIDTPLEVSFSNLSSLGISYKTYIDYSRGRTILHTVTIDVTRAPVKLLRNEPDPVCNGCSGPDYKRLLDLAAEKNVPVLINGMWADYHEPEFSDDAAVGWFYSNGYVRSQVDPASATFLGEPGFPNPIQNAGQLAMLGISGSGTAQRATILLTDANYMTSTNSWKRLSGVPGCPTSTCPIFDAVKPFYKSPNCLGACANDFQYAVQMDHVLLLNGRVDARGVWITGGPIWDYSYSRTSVGVNDTGTTLWLVVADGEGLDGSGGATCNQVGEFYKNELGAYAAMNFDSGESTEMVLHSASNGWRRVNVLTSENHAADGGGGDYIPSGRVYGYLSAGQ